MKYYGVNLGGWLVLERWITPSLFNGLDAQDEAGFCEELGSEAVPRLERHRKSFIVEEDFAWLRDHGINAVRVPIPHWVFGGVEPYVGCADYVDWLLAMATVYDIHVLLDLHTAPGSQNGNDHSGRIGPIGWPKVPETIDATLTVLEAIAMRWGNHANVIGIELLNEPARTIDHALLEDFYMRGIGVVHQSSPGKLSICSDAFRPTDWKKSSLAGYRNVALDMHLYQAFDKPMRPDQHIRRVRDEWGPLIKNMHQAIPVIVGEWSLGLGPKTFRGLDDFGRDKALRAFGTAQMEAFDQGLGWFFWTYKTEDMPGWSYRTCVKRGWLPASPLLQ